MPKNERSRPARKRTKPTVEPTAEPGDLLRRIATELGDDELGDDAEDLLQLPAETWEAIRDRQWELLDVMETEGQVGAMRWLDERGLAYKLTAAGRRQ